MPTVFSKNKYLCTRSDVARPKKIGYPREECLSRLYWQMGDGSLVDHIPGKNNCKFCWINASFTEVTLNGGGGVNYAHRLYSKCTKRDS